MKPGYDDYTAVSVDVDGDAVADYAIHCKGNIASSYRTSCCERARLTGIFGEASPYFPADFQILCIGTIAFTASDFIL